MGTLARAASAAGAAVILSAIAFAAPAEATSACWDDGSGRTCRDYSEGATGRTLVRAWGQPTFTGILKAGQTLTSYSGSWERAQTLKYQWLRDDVIIPGAEGETYDITESDEGRSLALRVTGSADGLKDGVTTTLPSPKVSATNTAVYRSLPDIVVTGEAPVVWGWSRVGFTLELNELGTWSVDNLALQWQADGVDIEGATSDTYKIRTADLGKVVTLKVTGSWPDQGSLSKSNTAPAVTPGYIQAPDEMWLDGGNEVGNTLSVVRGLDFFADGEPISVGYRWLRDGQPITGAIQSTYRVVAADRGHKIWAQVTAAAPGYWLNTQTALYNEIVDGEVNAGGQPTPSPDPTPSPSPTATPSPSPSPNKPAPAPTPNKPAPASENQAPAPAPNKPAPAPAPSKPASASVKQAPAPAPAQNEQAPIGHADTVRPTTRNVPAPSVVPARASGGFVQPQAAVRAESPVADAAGPVKAAAPVDATPVDTAPAATASPAPSSTPGPAATTAQAASTSPAIPLPLVLWIAGVLIAAGLVWVIRPLRASLVRLVARKAP